MISTTENFREAFAKGDASPVVVARLYFRDLTSSATYKSWDVSSDTIYGLQEAISILGESTYGLKENLLEISQLSSKLDPLTRAISSGDLSLRVDGYEEVFNKLVPIPSLQATDQTWDNKLVRVYLAERSLDDPADWLPIFHGVIVDAQLEPDSNVIEFSCRTLDDMFNKTAFYGGTFHSKTPLETSHDILTYALTLGDVQKYGATLDAQTGGETFDQTNAEFSGTAAWSTTNLGSGTSQGAGYWYPEMYQPGYRMSVDQIQDAARDNILDGPLLDEFPGPLPPLSGRRGLVPVVPLVNLLLRPYMGSVYFNGAGRLKCKAFKTTTDKELSAGQYSNFRQDSGWKDSVINRVRMNQDAADEHGGPWSWGYFNAASVEKFGRRDRSVPSFPFMRSMLWSEGARSQVVTEGANGAAFTLGSLYGMTGITTDPATEGTLGYAMYGPHKEIFSFDRLTRVTPQTEGYRQTQYRYLYRWYYQYTPDGYLQVENDVENDPGYPANLLQGGGLPVTASAGALRR